MTTGLGLSGSQQTVENTPRPKHFLASKIRRELTGLNYSIRRKTLFRPFPYWDVTKNGERVLTYLKRNGNFEFTFYGEIDTLAREIAERYGTIKEPNLG